MSYTTVIRATKCFLFKCVQNYPKRVLQVLKHTILNYSLNCKIRTIHVAEKNFFATMEVNVGDNSYPL